MVTLSVVHRPRPLPHPLPARLAAADRFPIDPPDPDRAPWPGSHVEVGGLRLYVRTTPSPNPAAEPALYVHGLGGASTNFTDVSAALSPWLAGESIDLPGFGRSDPAPDRRYSIPRQADRVAAYLDAAGRGPVHLVGNSMGGAVTIALAARRPDLVRTLSLISPAVPDLRVGGRDRIAMQALLVPFLAAPLMRRIATVTPEQQAAGVLSVCFARPERVPDNRIAEAVAEIAERRSLTWADDAFIGSVRAIGGNYVGLGSRSPWRWMASITAPTLVLWGAADRLVDPRLATRVAATIPDADLTILPDVGHTAQLEDPVSTARAILSMIDRANQLPDASGVSVWGREPSDRT